MALPIGTPRPCKGCGCTIHKRTFCGDDCRIGWYKRTGAARYLSRARARGVRPVNEVNAERRRAAERECVECGTAFIRNSGSNSGSCCSKQCDNERRRRSARVTSDAAMYSRWAKRAKAQPPRAPYVNLCRDCGVEAGKWQHRCEPCRAAHVEATKVRASQSESTKRSRRRAKAWRRAIERGVEAERFDPFEIFDRDAWRCHICRVSTPRRLRGTYHDQAPELDHIIPLAAGGQHTRINTACACRKCNITKGAKPLGQMRLVA